MNLPIPHPLGTPVDGLDYFGSCLGLLEHTGHAVTALTEPLYSEDNLASLTVYHPTWVLWWLLFLFIPSALSAEGSVSWACVQARASVS